MTELPRDVASHNIESDAASASSRFRLGDWVVDGATRELTRGDRQVRLEPKVMRVLTYLVAHPGRVVTRYELESSVWTGMVVTDDAVTNTVIKLRRALGDSARESRYIETIAKSGYRLIARVEPLPPAALVTHTGPREAADGRDATQAPGPPAAPAALPGTADRANVGRRALPLLTLGLILAVAWWTTREPAQVPQDEGSARPVVAVLPFDNLSGDVAQNYFANGITQDLITDLSKLSGLQVVAIHSSLAVGGSGGSEQRIGDELGADFIVRGSVQRAGDRLRINVNLVEADDGRHRWGERYDRQLADIFSIQDEIGRHVVSALRVELGPAERERFAHHHVASIEAYDAYLRGLDLLGRRSSADNPDARTYFEQAIALEPGYARAYAGLAMTYALHAVYGHGPHVAELLVKAEEVARRGLAIDENLPQLHYAMGLIDMFGGDLAAAVASVSRAIELRPSYADGYGLLAWILHFAGRPEEGMEAMRQAIALNPHVTALYRTVKAALHYELGELQPARRLLEESSAMNPDQLLTRIYLAAVYAALGDQEQAVWQAEEILSLDPDFQLDLDYGFPIRDPRYRERFLADLARAGLVLP